MRNLFLAATAATLLALFSVSHDAFAEPTGQTTEPHQQLSAEDQTAFTDARIAALKTGF
jgi:hypothetical protein